MVDRISELDQEKFMEIAALMRQEHELEEEDNELEGVTWTGLVKQTNDSRWYLIRVHTQFGYVEGWSDGRAEGGYINFVEGNHDEL